MKYRKKELLKTSPAYDVMVILQGEYEDEIGFIGDIWLRAKVKNNTIYTFEQPVTLFITPKDYQVIDNNIGNKWPSSGVMLMNQKTLAPPWKPGEVITVSGKLLEDFGEDNYQDYEIEFEKYLLEVIKPKANDPTIIDDYISTFYGMGGPFPISCQRKDCPICGKEK